MATEEEKLVERLREGTTIRLSETAATYTPPPKLQIEAADAISRLMEETEGPRVGALAAIAAIREVTGLGAKPMLTELPAAIAGIVEERDTARIDVKILEKEIYLVRNSRDNIADHASLFERIATEQEGRATAAEARVAQLETLVSDMTKAARLLELAEEELHRAEAVVEQPRLMNAGTRYWAAKQKVFSVAFRARTTLSQSPDRESGT